MVRNLGKWALCLVFISVLVSVRSQDDDPNSASFQSEGFIRVQDGRFVDEACTEYFFTGWNSWALVDAATWIVRQPPEVTQFVDGKNPVVWMFDEAQKAGFNMLRLFGHATRKPYKLQTSPGVYDETIFQGLDYIINEAGKRGIKLIISFSTNWNKVDSKTQYVSWAPDARIEDDFWLKKSIRTMFKNHVKTVLTRTNTFNKTPYKDDPTIFAWNIFNEMRCYAPFCHQQDISHKWNREMAEFIKSIDSNHLLSLGHEGFYSWGCPTGPGTHPLDESHATGQDFLRDSAIPEIDFAAIHLWADNWDISHDPKFPLQWVRQHAKDSEQYIKKPLVLEEFGVEAENTDESRRQRRDPVFKSMFREVESSVKSGGGLRAAMFWEWFINDVGKPSIHGVKRAHSTWNIVTDHGKHIAELNRNAPKVENCTPGRSSAKVRSSLPDNQYKVEGCCDAGCNAAYADYKGETFQESIVGSAAECCSACRFANIRNQECTGWSWCPCGSCNGAKKGTCRLKRAKNPFYPTFWQTGKGQPWVSGALGSGHKTLPSWKCHPTGTCAYDEDCKDMKKSIVCPDASCNAGRYDLWFDGKVLVLSTNGKERPYGPDDPPDVTSAAQCCAKCKETKGCNGWRFCPRPEGCSIYRKPCSENKAELGPYEDCAPNGLNYPQFLCTLFKVKKKVLNPRVGAWNIYVSGLIE